jgi:hypothetical protein
VVRGFAIKLRAVSKITFIHIDIRQTGVKNGAANQFVILSHLFLKEDV